MKKMRTAGFKILSSIITFLGLFALSAIFAQANAATLSLSPASGSYEVGDAVQVKVILNTGGEQVYGADMVLEYDTAKLTFVSVTETSSFSSPYPTKTESSGTILISANSPTGVTGSSIEAAVVNFTAKATGSAVVDFVAEGALASSVPASGTFEELLTTATGGTYTIATVSTPTPVGKGTIAPATGITDSLQGGIMMGFSLIATSGLLFFLARRLYKS